LFLTSISNNIRFNLNANAWRRLREVYADQSIPAVVDLQNRFAGIWLSTLERIAYGPSKVPAQPLEVIFVIGHWRSGTTLLHELLCQDPRSNFPTTYACMNPQVFPITEKAVLKRLGNKAVRRPMDEMSISLGSPQEDEFALLGLGAPSPYEGLLFPKVLDRGMAVADPDDLPEIQQRVWIRIFSKFLSQVAVRKPGGVVVLKSPTHSFRVKLLSRLYPNARFIHIVRNPIEVFNSTLNMWKELCSLYALTDLPDSDSLTKQVIANWINLEEKLDAAVPSLRAENYVRVRFEELTTKPVAEMERIYDTLRLERFSTVLPLIERYLAIHANFKKNRFDLAPENASEIYVAWRHIFEKYGYPAPTPLG
jgi:hypothetical protein